MTKKIIYALVVAGIVALIISPFFIKIKIECKSQFGECPYEINSKLQILNSKFLFQAKKQTPKILKSNYLVSEYSTQFKLPNILLINLIIKKPSYAVFEKSSSLYFLIDKTGSILYSSDVSNLPTLIKESVGKKIGEKVSNSDIFALSIIEGMFQMYQISSGSIVNDALVIDMPGGIRVIFPLGDNQIDVLLGSFRLIYTRVTSEFLGKYSEIDMRYKNPILR